MPLTSADRKSRRRRANTPRDVVFEHAPFVGLVVRREDERIIEVNREWELATGITRADAVGRTLAGLGFATEDGEAWVSVLGATAANGLRDRRVRLSMPSGEVRTALVNADPIRWKREACVVVSARDLTTLEGTSEALARERLLELATTVALWEWDLATDRVWYARNASGTWLRGARNSPTNDRNGRRDAILTTSRGSSRGPRTTCGPAWGPHSRIPIRHRDGAWRWILSRATAILDRDGVERLDRTWTSPRRDRRRRASTN